MVYAHFKKEWKDNSKEGFGPETKRDMDQDQEGNNRSGKASHKENWVGAVGIEMLSCQTTNMKCKYLMKNKKCLQCCVSMWDINIFHST